jgi:PAS domain S-box-containing protein
MEPSNKEVNKVVELVADSITAMLGYWDQNLVCRYANNAYSEMLGKSRDAMLNKMTFKEILGSFYQENLPYINGVLQGKIQTFEREIEIPEKGIKYYIENFFPDVVNGEVKGFVVHVADITALKLEEKKLLQSNELLLLQNKRLTDFSNIITHNLNNYAYGFSGILDLLINTKSEIKKEELLLHLKILASNFNDTINNLKQIADVQNKAHLELVEINLYDYIIKTIIILSPQIISNHCIINNLVPANTIVMGISAYIESILNNFISNAIRYKHPNRDPIIQLSCRTDSNEIILAIKDNGLGINLEKYGKELFQIYKTFHGNYDAQGIGLYITKYQIEIMGGKIDVESEENIGTSFFVHLKKG